jgi:BirA family transcriptional regulator, biotin operon repressor / biotin---[acetyl-CoA-carboxylase] ligase
MDYPQPQPHPLAELLGDGLHVLHLPQVESTSTRLKELIVAGQLTGPTVLVTNHQTAGRGTRSRSWLSSAPEIAGESAKPRDLALTFATPLPTAPDPRLSLALGALLAEAVERCSHVPLCLKWPNDLLAGDPPRKLGGLLLETAQGWLLVGVGINVNSQPADFPPELAPQLTTLAHERSSEVEVSIVQLAVVRALRQLPGVDIAALVAQFRERDCTAGTRYVLKIGVEQVPVVADRVLEDGALLLHDAQGNKHRVAAFTDLEREL